MNPILPARYFIPDVEARVWNNGRIYLYGSCDIGGNLDYCSHHYHVFSSSDLVNWTDHGVSFQSKGADSQVPWSDAVLYAPDCIYRDGIYYLYFCQADNSEGVALSTHPQGPFQKALPVLGAHGDAIDPAIFIDDDGEAYLFWGQHNARGARLKPNMHEIDTSTLNPSLLNETEHGFHEGSSIRKKNGLYYFVYTDISRGRATCLSYAISRSPLGPYHKGGVIVDNSGCDPETWNNHGSIAEFNGQWYVFYHRSSQGSKFSRRVCIEPITFNEDGSINEVEMTTQGQNKPLNGKLLLEAWRACLLKGHIRSEVSSWHLPEFPEALSSIRTDDWAAYKYLELHKACTFFHAYIANQKEGSRIEIRLDQEDGVLIGSIELSKANQPNQWQRVSCRIPPAEGIHAVYLVFKGSDAPLLDLGGFCFSPDSN